MGEPAGDRDISGNRRGHQIYCGINQVNIFHHRLAYDLSSDSACVAGHNAGGAGRIVLSGGD